MGIRAVELRGASLLNLASQLPIKPICDLTGISAQAARNWGDLAARAWNAYPSLRTTVPTATSAARPTSADELVRRSSDPRNCVRRTGMMTATDSNG